MANYRITDTILKRIADAVRRVTGGSDKLSPSSIAEALENENIIDTSDGTADVDKMLSGYSAYVKGQKIEGSLRVKYPSYTDGDSIKLVMNTIDTGRTIRFTLVPSDIRTNILYGAFDEMSQYTLYEFNYTIPDNFIDVSDTQSYHIVNSEPSASDMVEGDLYFVVKE